VDWEPQRDNGPPLSSDPVIEAVLDVTGFRGSTSARLLPPGAQPPDVDFECLGWPDDGPTLDLDHEHFAYAGKFVMSSTGKAVARDAGEVVAAVAFNADRTDEATCWLRYVTVRADRRGEGIGPRLLAFTRDAVLEGGFEACKIAVNNPYAYDACYRAGFAFTGEDTGIAELVLRWPPAESDGAAGASHDAGADASADDVLASRYRAGLDRFAARIDPDGAEGVGLSDAEAEFVEAARERGTPERLD
jgi:GNAT superfamily N-acetyltransferase